MEITAFFGELVSYSRSACY